VRGKIASDSDVQAQVLRGCDGLEVLVDEAAEDEQSFADKTRCVDRIEVWLRPMLRRRWRFCAPGRGLAEMTGRRALLAS